MLAQAFKKGWAEALTRFKVANMSMGAAGYNPMLNGQAGGAMGAAGMPATSPKAPSPPTAPIAAGAGRASALG